MMVNPHGEPAVAPPTLSHKFQFYVIFYVSLNSIVRDIVFVVGVKI